MNTHADKQGESTRRSAAGAFESEEEKNGATANDRRAETAAQQQLQEAADNSEQVKQLKSYQDMSGNNPRATLPAPVLQRMPYAAVVQRIEDSEAGAYIGYTLGGDLPTLYFENGHFTQQHKDKSNEGWHPNKGDRHFIRNIDPVSHKDYGKRRGELSREDKSQIGSDIEGGAYPEQRTKTGGNGLMMEGDVHVTGEGENKKETYYLHPSRGRFIAVGDPGFDETFNAAYAKEKVNAGALAANEGKR